ncbi:MAG: hypothetical protein GC151_02250 [Betaproteobacteria bacterium]|nr:hypothetical protein [Betaproteobacteria bacterium]
MKPVDPATRSLLAAEYVVGTLKGKARVRFELWLRSDPALRTEVAQWASRLEPLAEAETDVEPGHHVWAGIEARIDPGRRTTRRTWLGSLVFWRWSSVVTASLAAIMFGYIVLGPPRSPSMPNDAMVVVMSDQSETPMMTVAWMPHSRGTPRLKLRVMGHQTMAPDTAWELWMIPGPGQKPQSLGLITTHATQYVQIPPSLLPALNRAAGMAMSVEPHGGSPTGSPTGPVLYSGRCVKI